MDFSTSVFVCPLHTVSPYPRFSALHAACCFTRPQALTRASALYTAEGPYTQLAALHGASRLHPIHQPSHSFIEGPRFHMAQLSYTLQHLIGMTIVIHPSDDIVYSRGIQESDEHNNEELYCCISTQQIADKPTKDIQCIQQNYTCRCTHMREANLYE